MIRSLKASVPLTVAFAAAIGIASRVVSSATSANLYFVAMEFSSNTENFKGSWATDSLEGTGNFWAVDKVAQKNTTWPKGSDADPKITEDDPAAKQAMYNWQRRSKVLFTAL